MKRGWLSLIIIVAMIGAFWYSPGAYGILVAGGGLVLLAFLPALSLAGLARLLVPRRAWRLLLVPLLSGAAYFSIAQWWADAMPPTERWAPDWTSALMGWLVGALVVVLLELALGTPQRFLRTSHDQHP